MRCHAPISAATFEETVSALLASVQLQRMGVDEPYSDEVITYIADALLEVGKYRWSERPRTYLVLHLIDEVKFMDFFVLDGFKDIDFPYTEVTLPSFIKVANVRQEFLYNQRFVLSTVSVDLVSGGRHHHLNKSADNYFRSLKELGAGGFGYVDKVRSNIDNKLYANQ